MQSGYVGVCLAMLEAAQFFGFFERTTFSLH